MLPEEALFLFQDLFDALWRQLTLPHDGGVLALVHERVDICLQLEQLLEEHLHQSLLLCNPPDS